MFYIIEQKNNNGIYLVEVEWSNPKEYNYTFSVGEAHYFRTYPKKERLKVLNEMYSMKQLKVIKDKILEYSQQTLF
jgi:hypothetical protein